MSQPIVYMGLFKACFFDLLSKLLTPAICEPISTDSLTRLRVLVHKRPDTAR